MSYAAKFAQHESIGGGEQPLIKMVVAPSVPERINNHHVEFPDDQIFFDGEGGSIIAGGQTYTTPNKTHTALLLRECVRYAGLALACEGIRVTNRSRQVVQTVLPDHFDPTFLIRYYRETEQHAQIKRKLILIAISASREDADRLQSIANQFETLLGDVFTLGYDFRTQLMSARQPDTNMTLVSRDGRQGELLLL